MVARKPIPLVRSDLTAGSENCNSLSVIGGQTSANDLPEIYPGPRPYRRQ